MYVDSNMKASPSSNFSGLSSAFDAARNVAASGLCGLSPLWSEPPPSWKEPLLVDRALHHYHAHELGHAVAVRMHWLEHVFLYLLERRSHGERKEVWLAFHCTQNPRDAALALMETITIGRGDPSDEADSGVYNTIWSERAVRTLRPPG